MDYFMQGGYITGAAIFLISVFLVILIRGKYAAKELCFDGKIGIAATIIFFALYFLAHVIFFSPSAIYWEQIAAINNQSNQIGSLKFQLHQAQNPNDYLKRDALRLSDAILDFVHNWPRDINAGFTFNAKFHDRIIKIWRELDEQGSHTKELDAACTDADSPNTFIGMSQNEAFQISEQIKTLANNLK